jgi:hypothetical protein
MSLGREQAHAVIHQDDDNLKKASRAVVDADLCGNAGQDQRPNAVAAQH